jgi:hypothetical protein
VGARGELLQDAGQGGREGCLVVGVAAVAADVVVDALEQEQLRQRLGRQGLVGQPGEVVDAGAGDRDSGVVVRGCPLLTADPGWFARPSVARAVTYGTRVAGPARTKLAPAWR